MQITADDLDYIYDIFANQAEDNDQDNRILKWLNSLRLAMKLNQRLVLEPDHNVPPLQS